MSEKRTIKITDLCYNESVEYFITKEPELTGNLKCTFSQKLLKQVWLFKKTFMLRCFSPSNIFKNVLYSQ